MKKNPEKPENRKKSSSQQKQIHKHQYTVTKTYSEKKTVLKTEQNS